MATQSLMIALDLARTILEAGGDVPLAERRSLMAKIVTGYHRNSADVRDLYLAAGMCPPRLTAADMVAPAPWAPHGHGLPQRVLTALQDGTHWTSASLSAALGVSASHLYVTVSRLRKRGCPIVSTPRGFIRLDRSA